MGLPLPATLTPSKVSAFKECALAFRFSAIDRLPEPPSLAAVRGTVVHRALELLLWDEAPGRRTPAAGRAKLARVREEMASDPEFVALGLDGDAEECLFADAAELVDHYFVLEDPDSVRLLGTELQVEAAIGSLRLRGVIDRLELDDDGELVVTDYKTGSCPSTSFEHARMSGVHFYAFLCEQALGRRPARVQLLHLREPVAISTVPSDQSVRGLQHRAAAVWAAIERACSTDDFRPRVSRVCDFCAFKAYCPAWGGDPLLARAAVAAAPASAGGSDDQPDLTPAARDGSRLVGAVTG